MASFRLRRWSSFTFQAALAASLFVVPSKVWAQDQKADHTQSSDVGASAGRGSRSAGVKSNRAKSIAKGSKVASATTSPNGPPSTALPSPTAAPAPSQATAPAGTAVDPQTTASSSPAPSTAPQHSASAASPESATPDTQRGELMKVGDLDVYAGGSSDILLAYIAPAVSVDYGVLQLGNAGSAGTLSVGAQIEADVCGTVCWGFSALTPVSISQWEVFPSARAAYHAPLKFPHLDGYAFAGLGPVFAHSTVGFSSGNARVEYTGDGVGIGLYGGVGAHYMIYKSLFLGAEASLRYGEGDYSYKLTAGTPDSSTVISSGHESSWSLSGLALNFHVGMRF